MYSYVRLIMLILWKRVWGENKTLFVNQKRFNGTLTWFSMNGGTGMGYVGGGGHKNTFNLKMWIYRELEEKQRNPLREIQDMTAHSFTITFSFFILYRIIAKFLLRTSAGRRPDNQQPVQLREPAAGGLHPPRRRRRRRRHRQDGRDEACRPGPDQHQHVAGTGEGADYYFWEAKRPFSKYADRICVLLRIW